MPKCARLADQNAQLGGVAQVVGHHRAEKFDGIIGLQIGGLIGDDGVGGGVGFVEAVAGEFFQQIKNLVGLGGGDIVDFGAALDEALALLGHFLDFLFAHGAAQHVGARRACSRPAPAPPA